MCRTTFMFEKSLFIHIRAKRNGMRYNMCGEVLYKK